LAAGLIDAWLPAWDEGFLQSVVSTTALDVLHFSLHPISATRLGVAFGFVLLHAVVVWGAAITIRLAGTLARTPHRWPGALAAAGAWLAGLAVGTNAVGHAAPAVPVGPPVFPFITAGACAWAPRRGAR